MAVDHLSLYQLTIEDGTAFGDRYAVGKLRGLPDEDMAADMYAATQKICADARFAAYEVSNHARPGSESVHNLIYWRYGDYAGIGPGAHGRLTLDGQRYATETPLAPGAWLAQVQKTGHGESLRSPLSADDQFAEMMLMGLRLHEGINMERIGDISENFINKINNLSNMGMVHMDGSQLSLTSKGRPLLNAVLQQLLAD